jgi:hypothetical protein
MRQLRFPIRLQSLLFAVLLTVSCPFALAAAPTAVPPELEGLVKVKSKKLDAIYLLPDVDFNAYPKIMIDPVQVSFAKNWIKDINRSRGTGRRIDDGDAQRIAEAMRTGFEEIFAAAFKAKGYAIVAAPARDVLRLSPAVVNLYMNAPDTAQSGVYRTYTVEAGEATLVLQARDSTTGALLGVAVDRSETRNLGRPVMTTSASNRADFEDLFKRWSVICANGLEELKSRPPK